MAAEHSQTTTFSDLGEGCTFRLLPGGFPPFSFPKVQTGPDGSVTHVIFGINGNGDCYCASGCY